MADGIIHVAELILLELVTIVTAAGPVTPALWSHENNDASNPTDIFSPGSVNKGIR